MSNQESSKTFAGHPPGLINLFFTEIWERGALQLLWHESPSGTVYDSSRFRWWHGNRVVLFGAMAEAAIIGALVLFLLVPKVKRPMGNIK